MSLTTVTVTWDENDIGQAPLGGNITFLLSEPVFDSADGIDVRPTPKTYFFASATGTGTSDPLVANDNASLQPTGSYYTVTVSITGQAPYVFQSAINHANGATQTLSFLQANAAVPAATFSAYLPLPSGTPKAGQVPVVATGGSTATAWGYTGLPWFTAKSGAYIQGQTSVSTSALLTNQLLRLTPVIVTSPLTIAQVGAELVTPGDAATLIRLALYADDGTGYPGALITDAGSISTGTGNAGTVPTGGVAGVYMITLGTPPALAPGLYWLGGAVQGVTSVQPTMRTGSFGNQFAGAPNAVPGTSAAQLGYTQSSVSGAMPATFNAFSSAGAAGTVPRIIFKIQ